MKKTSTDQNLNQKPRLVFPLLEEVVRQNLPAKLKSEISLVESRICEEIIRCTDKDIINRFGDFLSGMDLISETLSGISNVAECIDGAA